MWLYLDAEGVLKDVDPETIAPFVIVLASFIGTPFGYSGLLKASISMLQKKVERWDFI